MKYLHYFTEKNKHDITYNGTDYKEPWTAYIEETKLNTYNNKKNHIIGSATSEFTISLGNFTDISPNSLEGYKFTSPTFDIIYTGDSITSLDFTFYNPTTPGKNEGWHSLPIKSITYWGVDANKLNYMRNMFQTCSELEDISGLANLDTSNVVNMYGVFGNCTKLSDISALKNWNVSKNTNFSWAFMKTPIYDFSPIENWDTSSAQGIKATFSYCPMTNIDLSHWNTNNVNIIDAIFAYCDKLKNANVPNLVKSKCTSIRDAFNSCTSLETIDLSQWDTSNVTTMHALFDTCSSLETLDLSNFKTSNLTNMNLMFKKCSNLKTLDISNFDTSKVTTMYGSFTSCDSLKEVRVTNCSSDTQNKIKSQLENDLSNYTWALSNGIITRS